MARRRAGFALLILGFVLLVLVVDFEAATRVQLLAAGLVAVIVFTYYRGEQLLGWKLGSGIEAAPELQTDDQTDGVFDTELPIEAFAEPVIEQPAVSLSRGSVLEAEPSAAVLLVNDDSETLPTDEAAPGEPEEQTEQQATEPEAPLVQVTEPLFRPGVEHHPAPASSPIFPTPIAAETALQPASAAIDGEIVSDQPVFIELSDYSSDELVASVRTGEASLVSALSESGLLSSEGPLTDIDVHTMVFVAVSSDDLLRVLLEGKAAEAEAKALRHDISTPELYQPAVELMESHP